MTIDQITIDIRCKHNPLSLHYVYNIDLISLHNQDNKLLSTHILTHRIRIFWGASLLDMTMVVATHGATITGKGTFSIGGYLFYD